MSKAAKQPLQVGDQVKLRGRSSTGRLKSFNAESKWARVEWDTDGPTFCHLHELERLPE